MGKQNRNPYRQVETHVYERMSNGRRASRNLRRWRNKKETGTFKGVVDNVQHRPVR